MLYIIDANNVAGKLKILGRKEFDRYLIDLFVEYTKRKDKKIELVFDGQESLGDRRMISSRLTVVYAPRDDYCGSADDKIVEMVERYINRQDLGPNENKKQNKITVVTDDLGLKKRAEEIATRFGATVYFERATWWVKLLTEKEEVKKIETDKKVFDDVSDELAKLWVK